jgi:integrase
MARDDVTLRLHLIPALGDRPIGHITPADVRTLVMTWLRQRKPSSVSRDYRTLAAICRFAVDQDLIARSPCRGIKLPTGAHRSVHVVDADELTRLAKAMGDFGPMAYVAAVLGLRWGEVAGLKVSALDLENRTLTVSEQITRGKGGQIVVGLPKSDAGRRTLSMPAALAEMLSSHIDSTGPSSADADAWVFPSTSGGPLHYANWYHRVWAPAVTAASLEGLTFHDLRRANATGLVAAGVDVKTAQTRLGHSSSRLTLDLYAQSVAARDRDAADALGATYMPVSSKRHGAARTRP